VLRRALGATALAPLVGVSRGNRCVNDRAPVEIDVRILGFERAAQRRIEWLAADFHVWRGAEPIEHARPNLAATIGGRLDEIEILDAAFVARESEKRQPISSSF
jgi:hypothetical protein